MIDKKLIILFVILLLITTAYFFEDEITNFINGEGGGGGNSNFSPVILNEATMEQTIDINNPMSLTDEGSQWIGRNGSVTAPSGVKFVSFDTDVNGIRAGVINMLKQMNAGHNTVTKLITVYAPPTENDTVSYVNDVATQINVNAENVLNKNYDTVYALTKAIIAHEQGKRASEVKDEDIDAGVNAAMAYMGLNA